MHFKNLCLLFSICVLSFALVDCTNTNKPENKHEGADVPHDQSTATEVSEAIAPPLENVDVAYQKFELSTTEAQTLSLDNGSTIEVPANAFVDKNGTAVQGAVDLKYREFHTAPQIIASGIPMTVKMEDGTSGWMQTAGMFEIKGFAQGEEVFIADDKSIQVNMASAVAGTFDFWYFNETQANWMRKGSNNPVENPARTVADSEIQNLSNQVAQAPVAPTVFDKSRPALNFNVNYSQFPEIKHAKGIIWQYAGKNTDKAPENNEWIFDEDWTDISLEQGKKEGEYQLNLLSNAKEYSIPVLASQRGTDLKKAQAAYQQKLQEFKALRKLLSEKQSLRDRQMAFTRSFSLNNFGIYNYDILLKQSGNVPMAADFEFEGIPEAAKQIISVYLVTGDRRSVVKFPFSDWGRFAFNPDMDNELVALLPGNKMAVFTQEDFAAQKEALKAARGQRYVFKMHIQEEVVHSVADIEQQMTPAG